MIFFGEKKTPLGVHILLALRVHMRGVGDFFERKKGKNNSSSYFTSNCLEQVQSNSQKLKMQSLVVLICNFMIEQLVELFIE